MFLISHNFRMKSIKTMYIKAQKSVSEACFADKIEVSTTFLQRLVGLLGRRSLDENQGLYLPGVRSVHTFFMRFSIDVIFFDEAFTVVKKVHCLRPFRCAFGAPKIRNTLELSCGTLEKYSIEVGDQISLINLENLTGKKMPSSEIALKVIKGPLEGQSILIQQNQIRIGSAYEENDLVLNMDGIVEQHAIIWQKRNGVFYIRKIGDKQVLSVNGVALKKSKKAILFTGDEIEIGTSRFQFLDAASEMTGLQNACDKESPVAENGVVYTHAKRFIGAKTAKRFSLLGCSVLIFMLSMLFVISSFSNTNRSGSSGIGVGQEYPMGLSETPIPLPADDSYGYIIGQDEQHPTKAIFTFIAESSDLNLHYTAGGIESEGEVNIYLNDEIIGSVPKGEKGWGKDQVLNLPAASLIQGRENRLTFVHTKNPPNLEQWGVKGISIVASEKDICDMTQAKKMYDLAKSTYEEKEISEGNIYLAHGYCIDALEYMKDCAQKEDLYDQVSSKADELKTELDDKYKDLKFTFIKALNVNDLLAAKAAIEKMVLYFPDTQDERHKIAAKKLEQINSMIEPK